MAIVTNRAKKRPVKWMLPSTMRQEIACILFWCCAFWWDEWRHVYTRARGSIENEMKTHEHQWNNIQYHKTISNVSRISKISQYIFNTRAIRKGLKNIKENQMDTEPTDINEIKVCPVCGKESNRVLWHLSRTKAWPASSSPLAEMVGMCTSQT